jgi:hypothetical protein
MPGKVKRPVPAAIFVDGGAGIQLFNKGEVGSSRHEKPGRHARRGCSLDEGPDRQDPGGVAKQPPEIDDEVVALLATAYGQNS